MMFSASCTWVEKWNWIFLDGAMNGFFSASYDMLAALLIVCSHNSFELLQCTNHLTVS